MMRVTSTSLAVIVFLSVAGCGPGRPHLQTLESNREGNKALKAQNFQTAMDKYLEALRHDPFVGQLHLNLGLTFEGGQQAEKALQSYKEAEALAEKEKNGELLFMARFNRAQLLGKAKKIDEALEVYQKALEVIPSSNEVKVNIELLTQNQQGQGGGENKDQQQQGNQGQQQQNQQGQDQKDQKDQEQKDEPKQVQQSPKYKPRPFKGQELSEGDVKKILGELKQQEEKIRAEYNRKEVKEQPRDKDW
ncbi:tetratricopeptide repeat protein [Bdellovibrio bacteriovorus]|uniref:tetratricopeptide repeat protein n=1 Tax=Bdellovibrio bacteriovorus TaxID=959 RepID=UPI0035A5F8A9